MSDDCTEPDRKACPRMCQEFCNKAEEAKSELPSSTGSETKPKTIDFELYANLRHQFDLLQTENQKLRRIATHVPAKIYIKAREKAGFGVPVSPNAVN